MIQINNSVKCFVTLSKTRKGEEVSSLPFTNLITDTGLNSLHNTSLSSLVTHCKVGTGTTPPTPSDVSIETQLGVSATGPSTLVNNSGGVPNWYQSVQYTFTFPLGAIVGVVSEVYFGTDSTIFGRALVKDQMGNVTTYPVYADEQITVKYEVRKYPPQTDVSGVYVIDVDNVATNYNYILKAANVNTTSSSSYWYGSRAMGTVSGCVAYETSTVGVITGSPGGAAASGTVTLDSYIPGSFKRTGEMSWNTTAANYGTGIGAIGWCGNNSSDIGYQIYFTPKLPKTSDDVLKIPFEIVWSRG